MNDLWIKESEKFSRLNKEHQMRWIANLMLLITIFSRDLYSIKDQKIIFEKFRIYNEVMHRVSSQLLDISKEKSQRMPDKIFFEILSEQIGELKFNIDEYLKNIVILGN